MFLAFVENIPIFPHRTMLPTMVNMCSSLVSKTTKTSPEWIHGTVEGNCLHCPPARKEKKKDND